MKRIKTILAIALTAAIALSHSSIVMAAVFSDIGNHWAESAITSWSEYGIVHGYPDGSYRPDNFITRAELAQVIANLMHLGPATISNPFSDIPENAWYYNAVLGCAAAGYVTGYDDGTFKPADFITREQTFVILARVMGVGESATSAKEFPDGDMISGWARGYINSLVNGGVVQGYETGYLLPLKNITRAELVFMLNKIAVYDPETGAFTIPEIPDIDTPLIDEPAPGGGGGGGGGGSSSTPVVYTVSLSIQETTTGGATGIVGPVSRSYIASSVLLANVYAQLSAENIEQFRNTFGDPYANAIMREGMTAYETSDAVWRDYVDKYIEDVTASILSDGDFSAGLQGAKAVLSYGGNSNTLTGTFIVAVYDGRGALVQNYTSVFGPGKDSAEFMLDNSYIGSAFTIRAYAWDNAFVPIANYIVLQSAIDIKAELRNKATVSYVGAGRWLMQYSVLQGTDVDSAGNPVYRRYLVTLTITQS